MKTPKTQEPESKPCPLNSVKIVVIATATLLLTTHFIGEITWGGVVTSLLAFREFSEWRQNQYGSNPE